MDLVSFGRRTSVSICRNTLQSPVRIETFFAVLALGSPKGSFLLAFGEISPALVDGTLSTTSSFARALKKKYNETLCSDIGAKATFVVRFYSVKYLAHQGSSSSSSSGHFRSLKALIVLN